MLIRSKKLWDQESKKFREGWMSLRAGKIEKIEFGKLSSRAKSIDFDDLHIGPSAVDLHVHSRGFEESHKETFESLEQGAFRGGVSVAVCMANTRPRLDTPAMVKEFTRLAKKRWIKMIPNAAVTYGLEGEKDTEWEKLLKLPTAGLSDDGKPILDSDRMKRVLRMVKKHKKILSVHEEDLACSNRSLLSESDAAVRLGIEASPRASEVDMVERDIELTRQTKSHVHLCHISAAETVKMLRAAKRKGIHVTAEVTPHHALMSVDEVEDLPLGELSRFKVCPVIRHKEDRAAIWKGLNDGTIDCFASDHAPHSRYEKDLPYVQAMHGIVAFDNYFTLYNEVRLRAKMNWSRFFECFSSRPAEILGMSKNFGRLQKGQEASFLVFHPTEKIKLVWGEGGLSTNTPLQGREMRGRVYQHFIRAKKVYES